MNSVSKEVGVSAIRSLLAAVPFVGQLLNEAAFECRSRIRQERLNKFMESFAEAMKEVNPSCVNGDHITSEDFLDFLELVMHKASRAKSDEKLRHLKKVLVEQVMEPKPMKWAEMIVEIASSIEDVQVQILAALKQLKMERGPEDKKSNVNSASFCSPYVASTYGLMDGEFKYFIQDLISMGLLYDDGMNRVGTRPLEFPEITDLGLAFMEFVEKGEYANTPLEPIR